MFYNFTNALVRDPCYRVSEGLGGENDKPDYNVVKTEHSEYVDLLRQLGLKVFELEQDNRFPDSVFVEDPALVFKNGAILLSPRAPTRLGERDSIRPYLNKIFSTVYEIDGGFIEGGDVLRLENEILIGTSARTDKNGALQLKLLLLKLGYRSRIVKTPTNVLHFKSDCAALDEETILATSRIASSDIFKNYKVILTDENEFQAANVLRINEKLLVPKGYPRTAEKLSRNYEVLLVEVKEVSKIDAGLSCMSLRW